MKFLKVSKKKKKAVHMNKQYPKEKNQKANKHIMRYSK